MKALSKFLAQNRRNKQWLFLQLALPQLELRKKAMRLRSTPTLVLTLLLTVNTEGYFNSLSDTLAVGDIIFCRTSTAGTQVVSLVYVLTNASGVVDVTDGTVFAATDTAINKLGRLRSPLPLSSRR
jgi:hypothetical protein